MLQQMALFHSLLWMSSIPLCVCALCVCVCVCVITSFLSILLLMDIGCFHVLAIVNSAAMNLGYMYLFELEFCLFQIYPQERNCWITW